MTDPAENAAEPLTEEEERKLRTRAKYHTLGRDAGSTEREMLGMLATIDALRAEVKRLQAGVEVGTYGIDVAAVLSEELRARPAHEQVDALVIRCNQQQNDLSALRAERDALQAEADGRKDERDAAGANQDALRARLAAAEEERDAALEVLGFKEDESRQDWIQSQARLRARLKAGDAAREEAERWRVRAEDAARVRDEKATEVMEQSAALRKARSALRRYRLKLAAYADVRIDPKVVGVCHGFADIALAAIDEVLGGEG